MLVRLHIFAFEELIILVTSAEVQFLDRDLMIIQTEW